MESAIDPEIEIVKAMVTPTPEPLEAMTAMNGSAFVVGELLPWKGVYFRVKDVNLNGTVTVESVGLTKKCAKKLFARKRTS